MCGPATRTTTAAAAAKADGEIGSEETSYGLLAAPPRQVHLLVKGLLRWAGLWLETSYFIDNNEHDDDDDDNDGDDDHANEPRHRENEATAASVLTATTRFLRRQMLFIQ